MSEPASSANLGAFASHARLFNFQTCVLFTERDQRPRLLPEEAYFHELLVACKIIERWRFVLRFCAS